jgi:Uma2 family endonuclease
MQTLVPDVDAVVIIRPGDRCDPDLLFEQVRSNYPDLRIEQNASGDVLIMPPTGGESSEQNAEIVMQLNLWAKKDGRGRVFESNCLYILPDQSKMSPDASWVSAEKLRQLSGKERRKFLRLTPEFVIELKSDSDQLAELQRKMLDWRRNGVPLGWLINPDDRQVFIYRQTESQPEMLSNPQTVLGEGPVAGFALEMKDIWEGLSL